MKINYELIQDIFPANPKPVVKGEGRTFCLNCKKTLTNAQFFKSGRADKYPNGLLPHCKSCVTMPIVDTEPSTFLPLLKEIDVPYIPTEWRALLVKKDPKAPSIIGKYVSKMRLNQFRKYSWKDTKNLVAQETEDVLAALRMESDSESEAENKLKEMFSLSDIPTAIAGVGQPPHVQAITDMYGLSEETSKYGLTAKEISDLKLDWGEDYSEDQFLQLEQLFQDMRQAYIIQDPIAVSNARIICKMTIKMNRYLDIDDVESAAKLSRQLDLFIKSANLAPVQQKDRQQTTFAISQVAFLVEREGGFVPEFFTDSPGDKIDQILEDLKEYTAYLVRGESNIAEMLENTETILAQEALPVAQEDYDEFALLEAELLGDLAEIEEGQNGVTT